MSEIPKSDSKPGSKLVKPLQNAWFERIVGMSEEEFQKTIAVNEVTSVTRGEDGAIEFLNEKSGQKTKAGKFKIVPLLNLLTPLEEKQVKFNAPYPVLDIITRIDSESAKFVDFGYLQALPDNAGSLFQVVSKFNTLESHSDSLGYFGTSNFCTRYVTDTKSQGAMASVSCGAAAIARYYCAHMDSALPAAEWGQTKERQVCVFENLKEFFPITNGHAWLTNAEPTLKKKEWKKQMTKISVAYQSGCEVTSGFAGSEVDKSERIIVDQIFVPALNLTAETTSGAQNKNSSDVEAKSQFVLDAAYLSSYLLAISGQYSQLFLTLVGSDCNNNKQNIYDSLFLTHQKWARHDASKLRSVKLVVPEMKEVSKTFLKNLRAHNIPYRLTVYSAGVPKVVEKFVNIHDEL